MNILSIGNSFSIVAQHYLYDIAKTDKTELTAVNLYIGGCPLSIHYKNMLTDNRAYILFVNGMNTRFCVSIKEAVLSRDWDYITLQQVSHQSYDYETYQPYLNNLADFIRKFAPKAKLCIHQTWAYEQDSQRLNEKLGYKDHKDMFSDIEKAYNQAAEAINADGIVPSGILFQKLLSNGIEKVHRDTFHANVHGRYALALLWYKYFTGRQINNNCFFKNLGEVTLCEDEIIKKCVNDVLA